jgi:hypothetical protein
MQNCNLQTVSDGLDFGIKKIKNKKNKKIKKIKN